MGAELDSLADFVNFGVVPALVLYFWSLFFLVGFAVLAAAALTYFWVVMIALCLGYVGMIIWGPLVRAARGNRKGH